MKVSQIDLQHCKAASAIHSQSLAVKQTDISVIQEPWINKGLVSGLDRRIGVLVCEKGAAGLGPRAAVFIKGRQQALRLSQFCSRDLAAAMIKLKRKKDGTIDRVVCSAYLSCDSVEPPPTEELINLVRYCADKGLHLVVGCDVNSRRTVWGSSDTNKRGTALLEYLSSVELDILNKGSRSTFITSHKQKVINLPLCNHRLLELISDWWVQEEHTLLDHRRITFSLAAKAGLESTGIRRNPRATVWSSDKQELGWRLQGPCSHLSSASVVESEVIHLQSSIIQAFEAAYPAKPKVNKSKVPWWHGELGKFGPSSRKLLNRALRTNKDTDWAAYTAAQKEYN
ncbi:uncharacterized protein [Neodiprion pinetum]|uniref:uncharacterized protein n=1 Tax=Neodiprion pinetum TaxID=441929 RepID=UPI003723D4E3